MTELSVKTEAHVKVVLQIKDIAVFVTWASPQLTVKKVFATLLYCCQYLFPKVMCMCRRGWVAIGEWNGLTVLDYICHVIGAKFRGKKRFIYFSYRLIGCLL